MSLQTSRSRWAADVLAIAGAPASLPSPHPDEDPTSGHGAPCARFRIVPQIERIAHVVPGRAFAPAEMSDAFADTVRAQAAGAWAPGPATGEHMLCTTEVGLVNVTRIEEHKEVHAAKTESCARERDAGAGSNEGERGRRFRTFIGCGTGCL
jgi:hypothetical protein